MPVASESGRQGRPTIPVKEALENVRVRIEAAAQRSGRRSEDVTLVAVTKGVSLDRMREAYEAGLTAFGENRVQEAEPKIREGGLPAEWHMVGHLQSNKAALATDLFQLIHSVDSIRLAEKLNREAELRGRRLPVLLEVNVSGEAQKYGFQPEALYAAIDALGTFASLSIRGLMGMAPNTGEPEPRRAAFRKLKNLFSVCKTLKQPNLELRHLSMGMSDDFEIAVEEGATMIRLGRALFGG